MSDRENKSAAPSTLDVVLPFSVNFGCGPAHLLSDVVCAILFASTLVCYYYNLQALCQGYDNHNCKLDLLQNITSLS